MSSFYLWMDQVFFHDALPCFYSTPKGTNKTLTLTLTLIFRVFLHLKCHLSAWLISDVFSWVAMHNLTSRYHWNLHTGPIKALSSVASRYKHTPTRTYWLLPGMRCDWSPGPDSFGPRTRSCHRRACSVARGRCVGRRGTRWAAACGGNGGCHGPSRPAPRLCTIPPWGLDGPRPCSWEWLVPLWTQWGQRGAPRCGEGSLPGEDETLERKEGAKVTKQITELVPG